VRSKRNPGVVAFALAVLALAPLAAADKEYTVRGMVLRVDRAERTFVVSHERIEGLMDSMVMPFEVRAAADLDTVVPGAVVTFTLVVAEKGAYATKIQVRRYESVEQDPRTARRLAMVRRAAGATVPPLKVGEKVPDFTLTDQVRRPFTFSSLAGKVVAVNFVYTRCALPQFCLRVANNFGVLQKRFARELARGDLSLVTITFDPERDTPEVLAAYASQWKADPATWHFLTGSVADVRRVCSMFGMEYFPDEGLMTHSLRTAVIDRQGALVASIEGNLYTPEQLGDLVLATLQSSGL
jgi:protein SCO1/2